MTEEPSQYFAFISYSHKDKEFAEGLHHHLEHYKLPSVLCKEYPLLPQKIRPVFLDRGNLGAGELRRKLHEALEGSRFLIVICSRHSAQPNAEGERYIDEEVNYFHSIDPARRFPRIIPIIYREHKEVPAEDCLPPAISALGLSGDDVQEIGKERCFNNVIARMLGLDAKTLWKRWRYESNRRRQRTRALSAFFLAIVSWVATIIYLYFSPTYICYADYVEFNNIPLGIGQLTNTSERPYHYRFTMRRQLPREVVCCNPAGEPIAPPQPWLGHRPACIELEYDANRQVTRQIHKDEHGNTMVECAMASGLFIDLRSEGNLGARSHVYMAASTLLQEKEQGEHIITRLEITRDDKGAIIQEMFCNTDMERVPDAHGIWGRRYERNQHGRELSMRFLNQDEQPAENRLGIAGYDLTYANDTQAAPVQEIRFVDSKGNPVLNTQQWASARFHRNAKGRVQNINFYDTEGNPCRPASISMLYNDKGNCYYLSYYDADIHACLNDMGYAHTSMSYDKKGRLTEQSFYNTDNQPCLNTDGVASISFCYDERGRCVEEAFFGLEGKPCLSADGYARFTSKRHEKERYVETTYFDTEGKPCNNLAGWARSVEYYDDEWNLMRVERFDAEGGRLTTP